MDVSDGDQKQAKQVSHSRQRKLTPRKGYGKVKFFMGNIEAMPLDNKSILKQSFFFFPVDKACLQCSDGSI